MDDITHYHNQRPIYELENSTVIEWDNPLVVQGEKNYPKYPTYHPVIIDIETSAKLGQTPILCVIYDSLSKDLIILYKHGYQEYFLDENKVKEILDGLENIDYERLVIDNLTQSKFERYVLYNIAEWNKKAKNRRDINLKSLVAHNAVFDIPMLGSPNDELLDSDKIPDKYEMSVQYSTINMVAHRAGQYGQIFQFFDTTNNFEPLYIPVGDTLVAIRSMQMPGKLKDACKDIGLDIIVTESDIHGNLTNEYVAYCINDVWATYRLYNEVNKRLNKMFGDLPIEHIYSSASLGKFVLRKMGYKRVGYTTNAIDRIVPCYFGGRTDAQITGKIVKNLDYTDILSEYPTVSMLTNVWDFMQCKYVTIDRIDINDLPEIDDLLNKDNWKEIADYYVKIKPNGATLPVRTRHIDDTTKVVTSKVYADIDLQYHYMDIISANLIDNEKKYEIVGAWKVNKHGKQNLNDFTISGVTIDKDDNVMGKSIEARKNIQIDQGFKDSRTKSLKWTANSLYGVCAERIVKEIKGDKHDIAAKSGFYNPHVATTITSGGRLLLALGEHLANKYNGELVYCDTDSLVLSNNISDKVIDDFKSLNPYSGKFGQLSMLEKEKENGYLYAVGPKKYVLFTKNGKILEVKEHGIGNYENLRDKKLICRLWNTILYYDTKKKWLSYYIDKDTKEKINIDILHAKTLNKPVIWSFNASTRYMRNIIDEMTNDYLRYGDWIQSTISYDNKIRYMALNLMDKSTNEDILQITMDNKNIINATTKTKEYMNNDDSLKVVNDIVFKFTSEAGTIDKRPTVNVTELKSVTKEATNRKDIFIANLEKQFDDNLGNISYILD